MPSLNELAKNVSMPVESKFDQHIEWIEPKISNDLNNICNNQNGMIPKISSVQEICRKNVNQSVITVKEEQYLKNNNNDGTFQINYNSNPITDPWQLRVMRDVIDKLPIPDFYLESYNRIQTLNKEKLHENILKKQMFLQKMPAWLESELLVESGEFQLDSNTKRYYPPCSKGKQCIGHTFKLRGQHHSCCYTSLMFLDEWNAFINEYKQPIEKRPCILCFRSWYTQLIVVNRQINMDLLDQETIKNPESMKFYMKLPTNTILQSYYNLINEENGYLLPYMLIPQDNEPLLQPVCGLNLDVLKIIIDPISGQQKIDQSVMLYKKPILNEPKIGEQLKNF